MSVTSRDLLKFKKDFPEYASCCNRLIVSGLKGNLREAYVWTKHGHMKSTWLSAHMKISRMTASILLKGLFDMGLLELESVSSKTGMQFVYRRPRI